MEIILYMILFLLLTAVALLITLLARQRKAGERELEQLEDGQRELRMELTDSVHNSVRSLGGLIMESQRAAGNAQGDRLSQLQRGMADMAAQMEHRLKTSSMESEQKLENIRGAVEKRLSSIQEDNNRRLDEMRRIVDEKLQRTLNERMTESFRLVSERLEQVYRGLGEMQNLAIGVGDLKKVLSNVKTRGILGEIQLHAILEEILAPDQYDTNVKTSRQGNERVEFAVKIPVQDGSFIYLPIDSKFPADAYNDLMDAYDRGPAEFSAASDVLKARIKGFAKDIRDKYVDPPNTTDFAIMFLPAEGLYAEAVKLGLVETLQRDYRVNIAGPSIMAALLNSMQMGFRSMAIQRRSGEVWKVLSAVKTEFSRFEDILIRAQNQINRANSELDKLIGVRTRSIRSSLKSVTEMPKAQAAMYFPAGDGDGFGEEPEGGAGEKQPDEDCVRE